MLIDNIRVTFDGSRKQRSLLTHLLSRIPVELIQTSRHKRDRLEFHAKATEFEYSEHGEQSKKSYSILLVKTGGRIESVQLNRTLDAELIDFCSIKKSIIEIEAGKGLLRLVIWLSKKIPPAIVAPERI